MPGVSREQIDRARAVPILDYILSNEPNNVRRIGSAHYLKDHDSLEISNGLWNWHSRGIGGRNVVDYLIKVRGYSFVDAVRHLVGDNIQKPDIAKDAKPPPKPEPVFTLPPRNGNNERVIAYLQGRGIAKPLILDCIKRGAIYESAQWHNCVFVGRDDSGKARYATLRGTIGDFKRDADCSDKRFGFILSPKNGVSNTVAAFESPVDALSHQVLYPDFDGWRLSLGGTSLSALTHFLDRHKEVKSVVACTDGDKAGDAAAAKIIGLPGITGTRSIPLAGKDWNDMLMAHRNGNKPSLIGKLEAAKVTAAELNSLAKQEWAGDSKCR